MDSHNNPENFTGFEPGQKLLYLTELGGQPHMRIVTFVREIEVGRIGNEYNAINVREFNGYVECHHIYSFESIKDMFDDYDEKDARRWRAIDHGILPAVQLSDEEMDKIIDKNEEWCKAYEARVLDQIPEDQRHTDGDEDDHEYGPSAVHGSSSTCQP